MHVGRLLKIPVTVTRVASTGAEDDFGDPTEETTTATYRGWAWQTSRTDETASTDLQVQEWRLALHRSAAGNIDGGDRVTYEGVEFEVFGPPWIARNPRTQRVEYVEATIRKAST